MSDDANDYPPASLIKRLMAFIYDLLLLTGLFMIMGTLATILPTFLINDGHAITREHSFYLINQIIVLSTLFLSGLVFYGWFWTHGGQTLGMKTWRIQLISNEPAGMSWKQAVIRYFAAILSWCALGLGFLWSLIDRKKRCWHDILSSSQLVQLPKK
ncbi:MAG TPA: RDD family protein [Gammaproteobacteria bacterium]|nr:RDD family protein [Gammaproteobacteria bacterium]